MPIAAVLPYIPTAISVLGTLFGGKNKQPGNKPYNDIASPLSEFIKSRIGKTMPTWNPPPEQSSALSNALQGKPSEGFNNQFNTLYEQPAHQYLTNELLPQVASSYSGAGTYWGGERAKAETKAVSDVGVALQQAREQGINSDIARTLQYTPAIIESEYKRYLDTLPEYSPLISAGLNLLQQTPYENPTQDTSMADIAKILSYINWKPPVSGKSIVPSSTDNISFVN